MKKVLIALFLISSFVACDADEGPQEEYFVKYKASIPSVPYKRIPVYILVQTPDGKQEFNTYSGSDFEMTYGPVLKGFKAKIGVIHQSDRKIMITGEIQTSTKNKPFTLKAVDSQEAMEIIVEHAID